VRLSGVTDARLLNLIHRRPQLSESRGWRFKQKAGTPASRKAGPGLTNQKEYRMTTTTTSPLIALANHLGYPTIGDQILTPAGDIIYCNFRGQVKLERRGHTVALLGLWDAPASVLAAAYERAVAA
jgi:hypothetical protein